MTYLVMMGIGFVIGYFWKPIIKEELDKFFETRRRLLEDEKGRNDYDPS